MGQYATFMYSIGLLDEKQRAFFQDMTDKATVFIRGKNFKAAFDVSNGWFEHIYCIYNIQMAQKFLQITRFSPYVSIYTRQHTYIDNINI